jgi:hypothetical protein
MALLVRRRGYTATRRVDGRTITYRVRPTVYYRRDVGAPGRGRKVIPELEEGKMTKVANEMGYPNVISIPDTRLREFARRLIRRYGEREAFGMAHAQVIFRKRGLPHLEKFRKIRDLISEEMRKTQGWQ